MSPERRRSIGPDEVRMWLNDRRGKTVTIEVSVWTSEYNQQILNTRGTVEHSSEAFNPAYVNQDEDLANLYSVGPTVIGPGNLAEHRETSLITASEYNGVEQIEIQITDNVMLRLGDPF